MTELTRLTDLVAKRRANVLEFAKKALDLQQKLATAYATALGATGPQDAEFLPLKAAKDGEENLSNHLILTPFGALFRMRTTLDGVPFDSDVAIKPSRNGGGLSVESHGETIDVGHGNDLQVWVKHQLRELEKQVLQLGTGAIIASNPSGG